MRLTTMMMVLASVVLVGCSPQEIPIVGCYQSSTGMVLNVSLLLDPGGNALIEQRLRADEEPRIVWAQETAAQWRRDGRELVVTEPGTEVRLRELSCTGVFCWNSQAPRLVLTGISGGSSPFEWSGPLRRFSGQNGNSTCRSPVLQNPRSSLGV